MKKYWIYYYKSFSNTYVLYWTTDKKMEDNLPNGSERISRSEAISRAKANSVPGSDGYYYASEWIYPADGGHDYDYPYHWFDTRTRIVGLFNKVHKEI